MIMTAESVIHAKGKWAEKTALVFLQKQGLVLIEKNYRTRSGEIDLIMQDNNTIAFIEVRYRSSDSYVKAVETIDRRKCERIIRTSQHYLLTCHQPGGFTCRFDVITITGDRKSPEIGWIKNAFDA